MAGTNSQSYEEFLQQFDLDNAKLRQVYLSFLEHIELGLKNATRPKSDIKCFHTYVQDLPRGDELGRYLALDLGGANFRVIMIEFVKNDSNQISEIYELPKELLEGTAKQLFDHLAECLYRFTTDHQLMDTDLPLGFTFAFPLVQVGLKQAILQQWTKGFSVSGVVGEDVGRLLNEAIERRGDLRINCAAILNDTTGTLMACAYKNPKCRVGVIVGTGHNMCYVERTENLDLDPEYRHKPHMIINTECGAFGDGGSLDFLRSEFDRQVDATTPNPGKQIFEKMISGMYMGEIVRCFLIKAITLNLIFDKSKHKENFLNRLSTKRNCFETRFIAEIEDDSADFVRTKEIFEEEFSFEEILDEDCKKLRDICEKISRRSSSLVSTAISALINKMNFPNVVVGIDGSVYRFHPKYDGYMRETMSQFVKAGIKFDIMLSGDGSGRGAALVAATASRCCCK